MTANSGKREQQFPVPVNTEIDKLGETIFSLYSAIAKNLPEDTPLSIALLIHYGELALKKRNRGWFEKKLLSNISNTLRDLSLPAPHRYHGRFVLEIPTEQLWQLPEILTRLQKVFGIANIRIGVKLPQSLHLLEQTAQAVAPLTQSRSFAVRVKRAQKNFPMNSQQLEAHLGAIIQQESSATVNLTSPDVLFRIELFDRFAIFSFVTFPGPGGLPSGSSGKAVALLSTGFDSPVAAWKMMKRGVHVIFVHFHSVPYTTPASKTNAHMLATFLTQWQLRSKLYLVPIAEVQKYLMLSVPGPYRVIFYRRTMYRLAEKIADREGAKALITGESVGQVASQTLENLHAVNEVVSLPVLRPLAGDDKEEIIKLARQIGTATISLLPDEDCCSLFVPRVVVTKAKMAKVRSIAQKLDRLEEYEKAALQAAELFELEYPPLPHRMQKADAEHSIAPQK